MNKINVCPKCKSENNIVIDSRVEIDGTRSRRRKCSDCGRKWSTREIALDDFYQMQNFKADSIYEELDSILNEVELAVMRLKKEIVQKGGKLK